jgi:pSer/pThr/pTyr-binding forkhead associated (FHA) protein/DNA-binding NarL/FixJ family response regulator
MGPSGPALRVLYAEGTAGLAELAARLDSSVEVVREASPTRALALLESDGDFAVVVCDENVSGSAGLELLAAVRTLSPTTVRLLVSESLARATPARLRELVFRCLSPHASESEWRAALQDALAYHQLLASCPAQPVEAAREREAIRPLVGETRSSRRVPQNIEDVPNAQHEVPATPESPERGAAKPSDWPHIPSVAARPLVKEAAPSRDVIRIETATTRIGLQVVGRFVELLPGLTVVGRSRTCHIPIPDPQISRRHATFSNTGRDVQVRNVSQTNGVRINGVLIERDVAHALKVGDRVMLGTHEIEVCPLGDYCPSFEPTQNTRQELEASDLASRSATLVTFARVAEKYFVLGQAREAERILRPLLEGLLRHCDAGHAPGKGDVELATDLVLRIAEANREGEWINYILELFTVLERPLPSSIVDRLYRVAPESQGVKMSSFRAYVDVLNRVADRLGPKERFQLRRIQGLETPLIMSAHL